MPTLPHVFSHPVHTDVCDHCNVLKDHITKGEECPTRALGPLRAVLKRFQTMFRACTEPEKCAEVEASARCIQCQADAALDAAKELPKD